MPTRHTTHREGHNQNSYRGYVIFYDQHKDANYRDAEGKAIFVNGRPWGAVVERSATGAAMPMPVGPIAPVGWKAPWVPDDKYIVRSIGKIAEDGYSWLPGTGNTNRFRIDYTGMIRDYMEAHEMYYNLMVEKHAILMPGAKVPSPGEAIPYQVRAAIGHPPKSPKIPEAALAGNRWILGQQMPQNNPATNKWEVIPDESLAKLLKNRGVDVLTNQQATDLAGANAEELARVKADMEALKTLLQESLARQAETRDIVDEPQKKRKVKSSNVPVGTE